ncbi:cell division protein CrgA [Actinomyces sp. zg-332]|uniref:cell division protein CrgA n=1 Tax=Actinomyces sp. zg-332 TaxID=2708340 RepID=UPI00141FACAC|nr:cell division protein CrgA [Actinomyces sp. zg-332]QPK94159.1 cell division protein CrgA [Actinomyces sp. zg-332]
MPESKRRKSNGQSVHSDTDIRPSWVDNVKMSPSWWAPVMVTLMLTGLFWIVVYYISSGSYPIPGIGNWNLGIGTLISFSGFMMALRWR